MDTFTLAKIVKQDHILEKYFIGVFAADTIPKYKGGRKCLIANTHSSQLPGAHWVALYRDGVLGEYFDSYGLLAKQWAYKFIGYNNGNNVFSLQGADSTACGHYCLYFLYYRVRGYKMSEIVKNLLAEQAKSDSVVVDFVHQHFDMPILQMNIQRSLPRGAN